ncbi:FxsA family protein [Magnetococcales bacterium HHB-1]
MFRFLLLIFIVIPIVEMYLLIAVGSHIGAIQTILAVFATAALGAFLVRREGLRTVFALKDRLTRGEIPAAELIEGVLLIVAGALLITPGFFTDGIGFLLVFRPSRMVLRHYLFGKITDYALKRTPFSKDNFSFQQRSENDSRHDTASTNASSEYKDFFNSSQTFNQSSKNSTQDHTPPNHRSPKVIEGDFKKD